MNTRSVEARLLVHEALLEALILTHPKPQDAFYQFSQMYPAKVRDLNKAVPHDPQLVKDLQAEIGRFAHMFPKP